MFKTFFESVGRYFLFLKKVFRKPEKWRIFWRQFINEADKLIISSILLVGVISIFIGGVLVIQTASNLENPIIDKMYIGYMVRESLILEFCSTMVALILAGKMGSNIASEIGSMRITEQIDALEIMGVNSANYLILPKICALVFFMPILVILSIATGLVGGGITCMFTDILSIDNYIYGLQTWFKESNIYYSIEKSYCFAFLIASISSYCGYYVRGGALQVGKASTQAVVTSSVMILLSDIVLTKLLLQ